eukprot:TRINITY_DN7545_c0_g1_i1.p1 TRINITY_DN7545_c0_g1~~TRINITY_DN7545_c0_g1_i1.p1  ORF type:complete len:426 (+),score=134.00 TRINITY_DN7545_c0_g1_i1:262-1539(+)
MNRLNSFKREKIFFFLFGCSFIFFLFLFGIYPLPTWDSWQTVVRPTEEPIVNSSSPTHSALDWMKRPSLLVRSPMNYGVDFDKLRWECDVYEISTAKCLRYLNHDRNSFLVKVKENEEIPTMIFHSFWGGKHWNNKISFLLKSFLFTQRIGKAQIFVWFKNEKAFEESKDHTDTQQFKRYSEWIDEMGQEPRGNPKETFIIFKKFQFKPFENSTGTHIKSFFFRQVSDVALSDLARVLLLHEYGGVYLDIDNLLLRDFTDLYVTGKDFAYGWSMDEPSTVNTAVFFLNKGSPVAKEIIKKGVKEKGRWFHPQNYLRFVEGTNFTLWNLPCPLFDPLWIMNDEDFLHLPDRLYPDFETFEELFISEIDPKQPHDMKGFFAGAWSLHYHGQWTHDFEWWNWMGLWNNLFDCYLAKNCENLYGELFTG